MEDISTATLPTSHNDDDDHNPLLFKARYQRLALMGLLLNQRWFPKNCHGSKASSGRAKQQQHHQQQLQEEDCKSPMVVVSLLPFLKRNLSYHRIDASPLKIIGKEHENIKHDKILLRKQRRRRLLHTQIISRYHEHRRNVVTSHATAPRSPTRQTAVHSRRGGWVLNIIQQIESGANIHPSNNRKSKYFQPCITPCKKFPPYSPFCQVDEDELLNLSNASLDVASDALVVASLAASESAATNTSMNGHNLLDDPDTTFSSLDVMTSSMSCVSKRKWNPPFPYSTAFGLFSNKVQNEHVSKCLAEKDAMLRNLHENNDDDDNNGKVEKDVEDKEDEGDSQQDVDKVNANVNANANVNVDSNTTNSHKEIVPLTRSQILDRWNELQDFGEFWIMEARWDQLRYKYQKSVYEMARNEAQMGCVIFSYYHHHHHHDQKQKRHPQQQHHEKHMHNIPEIHVQLEKRMNRKCPFCLYNGRDDLGLLMHCRTVHGEDRESRGKLTFDAGIDGERNLHIMVKGYCSTKLSKGKDGEKVPWYIIDDDDFDDFVYARGHSSSKLHSSLSHIALKDETHPCIPFVRLPAKWTTLLDSKSKKKKMKQLEQQIRLGDERIHPLAPSQYMIDERVPIRQYYHSKTMQPMATKGEWDVDSDDEGDDTWAHRIYESALQELDDVSPKEKMFMNKWNRFMESHTITADHAISAKCREFLVQCSSFLVANDLRVQFLLHLFNLWDNRLIPSSVIEALITQYDTFVKDRESNADSTSSRENSNSRDDLLSDLDGVDALMENGTTYESSAAQTHDENLSRKRKHNLQVDYLPSPKQKRGEGFHDIIV